MQKLNNYTSTGAKFWLHKKQMESYKKRSGHSIISTHISPEGSCNLHCSYCSVHKRDKQERIKLDVIKDYVLKLHSRGLQAVILTGGGEPTLYPQFYELVVWLKSIGLNIGLITNGLLPIKTKNLFSWIRISLNIFPKWQSKIIIPKSNSCTVGASIVYQGQSINYFKEIATLLGSQGVSYVRVLPDCLHEQENILTIHKEIESKLSKINSSIFMHQFKVHKQPKSKICHQSYFRPYLSEVDGGFVFPCDSVVLNNETGYFSEQYKVCKASDVLSFLDKKIDLPFTVNEDCSSCVFTSTVDMLDDWYQGIYLMPSGIEDLSHAEFV